MKSFRLLLALVAASALVAGAGFAAAKSETAKPACCDQAVKDSKKCEQCPKDAKTREQCAKDAKACEQCPKKK